MSDRRSFVVHITDWAVPEYPEGEEEFDVPEGTLQATVVVYDKDDPCQITMEVCCVPGCGVPDDEKRVRVLCAVDQCLHRLLVSA